MNRALFEHRGEALLESLVPHIDEGDQIWVFHEDSNEPHFAEHFKWPEHDPRVQYFDLFENMPELRDVVRRKQWNEAKEKGETDEAKFLNYHGQFFTRKVATIFTAFQWTTSHITWLDCDNVVNNKRVGLGTLSWYLAEKLLKRGQIWFKDRTGTVSRQGHQWPSETSFIVFRGGDGHVKEFVEFWWELYETGAVHHLKLWADANVFDFCRDVYPNIKYKNLHAIRPGHRCFCHQLGHRQMARLRESTVRGSRKSKDKV